MIRSTPQDDNSAFLPGAKSLARKLTRFMPLTDDDLRMLDTLPISEERFPADTDIIGEGMQPRSVFLLQEGMAVRYRCLADGRRQIMTFLLPGDLCNPHMFLLKTMDHSIGTLTPVRIAALSRERLVGVFATHPRVSAALWWTSLQEQAMLHEHIVSLGRRDAKERIAFLLCELLWRYDAMGLAEDGMYSLPLTQTELGDAVGLTPVHVNRVLRDFRTQGLILMKHRMLKVLDVEGLQEVASFSKDYLHFDGASAEVLNYLNRLEA